MNTRTVVK